LTAGSGTTPSPPTPSPRPTNPSHPPAQPAWDLQIFFRGTCYPGPHEPLIDLSLFDRAQQILAERGDDLTLRRSNQSDYLLTGLLRCTRCGRRHVGAMARGRRRTYNYYVCFSRHRYGRQTCDAERIPATALEAAVLDQLTRLLQQADLIRDAIRDAAADLDADRPRWAQERRGLDAEIARTDAAPDRYFRAFENGTMPETLCGERIDTLSRQLSGLKARREELTDDEADATGAILTDDASTTSRPRSSRRSATVIPRRERRSCKRSSARSESTDATESWRHTCSRPGLHHQPGQYPQGESNPRYQRERLAC
jgi:hypothetical protein